MKHPVSLLEFALVEIRERIQNGTYLPGEKLSSLELSEELGISRTPINAAINRLVAEGLAESIPRKGVIVRQLSPKQIRDIIDMRIMLETYAAGKACAYVGKHPMVISEMESLLEQFENIEDNDYAAAAKLESQFHSSFVSLAENDQLMKFFEINWSVGATFYMYNIAKMPLSRQKESFQEHKQIIELLKQKKANELCVLIEKHLSSILGMFDYLMKNDTKGIFCTGIA